MRVVRLALVVLGVFLLLNLGGCDFLKYNEGISAAVKAGDPNMCAKLD